MPVNDPTEAPIRAGFDNNVLLQAMSSANGPAGACFQAVREARIRLCLSQDLILEFADVASRPLLIRKLRLTFSVLSVRSVTLSNVVMTFGAAR